MKAVLILSGGLDSSTLGYWLKNNGYDELICISYNYGQRQIIELEAAKKITHYLGAKHHIIDITFLQQYLGSSSLTNHQLAVPHGEYSKENMQLTVVPNRNSVLLSLAWTIACVEQADALAYGAQGGDHYLYPDTRPDYFNAINLALRMGTEDSRKSNLHLLAPFIHLNKAQVIQLGQQLCVPFADTWTCYEGGSIHCGLCGACQNRKQGFNDAKVADPTCYEN
jgi:7-cyano-7-deazaguanine synthase